VYAAFDPTLERLPDLRFEPSSVWDRGRPWRASLRDSARTNADNR
jgi:hypothetical protein